MSVFWFTFGAILGANIGAMTLALVRINRRQVS